MRVLIAGPGAIGGTLAAWIAPRCTEAILWARGETAAALRAEGLRVRAQGEDPHVAPVRLPVVEDPGEAGAVDLALIAVKNYSLEDVAGRLAAALGAETPVLALQNGIENQAILPKHFKRITYAVVSYNAWPEGPGRLAYQRKGPIVLGHPEPEAYADAAKLADWLGPDLQASATRRFQDAAHTKLVINLANSLATLVGQGLREPEDLGAYQRLMSRLLHEGVSTVRAAGYREHKIPGLPAWWLLRAGAVLPHALTRGMFRKNVRKMVINSMAQDVLQRGPGIHELDAINGRIIALARAHGTPAPCNQCVYDLCRERFGAEQFEPMRETEVWARLRPYLREETS